MRTLAEWLALQESVHPRTIDLGLERVAAVARSLHLEAPPFQVITVGGTNGKGSVAALADALLRSLGANTGLFTSPHLVRYNERIRVRGAEVDDAQLIEAFERIEAARGSTTLTFFEYNTLAALEVFERTAVDVAVLEVGLGGRLDATNLLAADVAVVVSVGFDHRDYLGDTLESIGAEKAGIFRPGRPAVLGTSEMPESVFAAISRLDAQPLIAGRDFTWELGGGDRWSYRGLEVALAELRPPALAGSIQYRNAASALASVEALLGRIGAARAARPWSGRLDERTVNAALGDVVLPGRFQIVPGPVEWILDIAHNEPAARVLAAQLRERSPPGVRGRTLAVVGVLADKDAAGIAAALAPLVDEWIVCALPGPRGGGAREIAERLGVPGARSLLADSVAAGCEMAQTRARTGDRVVVFGSFYAVGPALEWLRIY